MITLTTTIIEKTPSNNQEKNESKLLNFVEIISLWAVTATTILLLSLTWL